MSDPKTLKLLQDILSELRWLRSDLKKQLPGIEHCVDSTTKAIGALSEKIVDHLTYK